MLWVSILDRKPEISGNYYFKGKSGYGGLAWFSAQDGKFLFDEGTPNNKVADTNFLWLDEGHVEFPNELEPVLALIRQTNDLGKGQWYEVVYFSQKWCSFEGSKTFQQGEQVVKWKYAKLCV